MAFVGVLARVGFWSKRPRGVGGSEKMLLLGISAEKGGCRGVLSRSGVCGKARASDRVSE